MFEGLTGHVVLPGDCQYAQARREWNKAVNKFPSVIVYCYEPGDVANAILWSRRQGIPLRLRSGGHNYEGYSTGTGKLVIDTSCMNRIYVDNNNDTVNVQAGTRLAQLYEALSHYGYAFPGGTCPTVAIAGLVLGGGIGLSTRYLGLTADSLIETNMVDAGGNTVTANNCHHSDLLWALKGAGGGNFGVVTSYKFALKRKVNKITLIKLEWSDNIPARRDFLRIWPVWLETLDRRMSAFGGIYKRGAWLYAFFYGRADAAEYILSPLLAIPGITLRQLEYVDFIEAINSISATYSGPEAFKSTGRFMQGPLLPDQVDTLLNIMDNAPSEASSYLSVYSLGGAVRDKNEEDTAFYYRNADYILGASSTWKTEQEAPVHSRWVANAFQYIYTISVGSYINFPYGALPNYQRAYYGNHVLRLQNIKQKYDPDSVFSFPQSIKTAGI
ncbi:FAD-binding oxidoreductase [Sporomusa aerivorans]|uniref:FAD-binding oxidoreductase n=1 Tax=Sporomusa aerivorans TaxID=204936 RepID=UPI00352B0D44